MSSLSEYIDELENDPEISKLMLTEKMTGKIDELRKIIYKISHQYGGDDAEFLEEYINNITARWTLLEALTCFRDIAANIPIIKWK